MGKRAWIGVAAAVLVVVVAGGGYALLLKSANDAVERSLAQFRAGLPAGASFAHGGYEVDLLDRSVVIAEPVVDFDGTQGLETATAAEVRVSGLEPDEARTRAARVELLDVRLVDAAEPSTSVAYDRLTASDVVVEGQPQDLPTAVRATYVGLLQVDGMSVETEGVTLSVGATRLEKVTAGRIGESRQTDVTLSVAGPEGGEARLRELSLSGLDLSELLAVTPEQAAAMTEEQGMAMASRLLASLTGIRLQDFRLRLTGLDAPIELASLTMSDPQVYQGYLVGGRSELVGLSIPMGAGFLAELRSQAPDIPLGERLTISAEGVQRYEAQEGGLRFDQRVTLQDLAQLEVSLDLGNLGAPPHAGMSEADLQVLMLGAALRGAEVTVTDLGLLEPALAAVAAEEGTTPEALVRRLVFDVSRGLRAMAVGPAGEELVAALEDFLTEGGRLRLSLAPAEAVPLLLVGSVEAPSAAVELLNPSFTASPR
jgi:hypothetical protein